MTATQQPSVTQALKPCPFCGGSANNPLHNDEWDVYALNCSQCDSGTSAETAAEAIEAWNTRHREASTAELRAENERLSAKFETWKGMYIAACLDRAGLRAENERLRSAAQNLVDRKFATYKARNGRDVGIQGDDGEMCWIVHSDDIFTLEGALSTQTSAEGGE